MLVQCVKEQEMEGIAAPDAPALNLCEIAQMRAAGFRLASGALAVRMNHR